MTDRRVKVVAAILAAGRGERFGGDKTMRLLGNRPVWRWSYDAFSTHPDVDHVVLVVSPDRLPDLSGHALDRDERLATAPTIAGGASRRESSARAVSYAADQGADVLLIHDAARPFVSAPLISAVLAGVEAVGAAAPATPVTDTIKRVIDGTVTTVPRESLVAMQTPQGARVELLQRAHAAAHDGVTDDMEMIEAIGVHPRIVPGETSNFKITLPEDFSRAEASLGAQTRTGIGYDVHAFSDDPARSLWLGGVQVPGRALDGHSDADVLLHAITDAILGGAALGDIGEHFPPSDPRWKNAPSLFFLGHAASLAASAGFKIVNVDATCIAEAPKIMPHAPAMRAAIAGALSLPVDRVSVKATTNERLGAIGRGEGIAAFAIATLRGAA